MNENVLRERIPRLPNYCNYDYVAQKLDVPEYAFRRLILHYDSLVGPVEVISAPDLTVDVDSLELFARDIIESLVNLIEMTDDLSDFRDAVKKIYKKIRIFLGARVAESRALWFTVAQLSTTLGRINSDVNDVHPLNYDHTDTGDLALAIEQMKFFKILSAYDSMEAAFLRYDQPASKFIIRYQGTGVLNCGGSSERRNLYGFRFL